jgi:hypothetical protein
MIIKAPIVFLILLLIILITLSGCYPNTDLPGNSTLLPSAVNISPTVSFQPNDSLSLTPQLESTSVHQETPLSTQANTNTHFQTPLSSTDQLPTQTNVLKTPDPTSEISPTPSPTSLLLIDPNTDYPEATIIITRPGPQSKVSSPFRVITKLAPGDDWQIKIEVVGEDGRVLVRKIARPAVPPGLWRITYITDLTFNIAAVAEIGRLQISVNDEYGRVKALASVPLILVSEGASRVNPPGDQKEEIIIQQPHGNVMIQGKSMFVIGLARPRGEKPLVVEIIDDEGSILGFGLAPIVIPENSDYGLFATEINFEVEEVKWVRVVVRERGGRIPGNVHLSSVEVVLSP